MLKKTKKDPVATPSKKPGAASDGVNCFSFLHENCETLKRFTPPKTDSETVFDSPTNVGISIILHV